MKLSLCVAVILALIGHGAYAESLQLDGTRHWLAFASSKDKDVAIGIGRYLYQLPGVRVVSSKSGFYAVIAGPYRQNSISGIKQADKDGTLQDLPPDAVLSQGANYLDTVWTPDKSTTDLAQKPYDLNTTATLEEGNLKVEVQGHTLSEDQSYTTIDIAEGGKNTHFDLGKTVSADNDTGGLILDQPDFNKAALAKLVPDAPPVLVITNFSGGAHCCTTTTFIAKAANGNWTVIKGPALDGDGFAFIDIDGDGVLELTAPDNSFYYSFDSYAASVAPILVFQLRDGQLKDVSNAPAMRGHLVQQLGWLDFEIRAHPDMLQSNGFLAGWVAAKIRLGQGDAAWAVFMKNYQKDNGFGPQVCKTGGKVEDCAPEKLVYVPTPKALAQFLKDGGYTSLPAAAEALLK